MELGLTDLRVLVTGGSAGIGLATAELFSAEGARVAIASRAPGEAAERLGATAIAADLATADGCEAAVAGAVEAMGGLDVLVNNAGGARIATFEDTDDAAWQAAWDLNVMGYVRTIRAALPHLEASEKAAIVNVCVELGQAAERGHAGVLGDQGGRAVAVAAGRRPVRRPGHPQQRGLPGPVADARLAVDGRPRRPDGRRHRPLAGRRAAGGRPRAGRWAGWPSRPRSPR